MTCMTCIEVMTQMNQWTIQPFMLWLQGTKPWVTLYTTTGRGSNEQNAFFFCHEEVLQAFLRSLYGNPIYFRPFIEFITPFIAGRGPPCI